jgi:hypothetical protein
MDPFHRIASATLQIVVENLRTVLQLDEDFAATKISPTTATTSNDKRSASMKRVWAKRRSVDTNGHLDT